MNEIPGPLKKVNDELDLATERIPRQSAELKEALDALERYTPITQVLTLELEQAEKTNLELSQRIAGDSGGKMQN